jgi:two-component system response regulator
LRSIVNLAKALQVTVGSLLSYATAPSGTAPRARPAPGAPGEILLIEDNPDDAALTARAFKRAKVTNPLRILRDAEEGIDYLFGKGRFARRKPARPQLILLDLNLPRMTGLDFLRQIKADRRTRAIPVVVLTMTQSDLIIIECGRLGAVNYVVKPMAIESLVRVTPRLNMPLTLGAPPGGRVDSRSA